MRDSREGTCGSVPTGHTKHVHSLSGEIVCPPEKAVYKASTEDRERQCSVQGHRTQAEGQGMALAIAPCKPRSPLEEVE